MVLQGMDLRVVLEEVVQDDSLLQEEPQLQLMEVMEMRVEIQQMRDDTPEQEVEVPEQQDN